MQKAMKTRWLRLGLSPLARTRLDGFTLVELMIVVAIIAILSAIALPAYRQYLLESHRASAKTALLDVASREEKYYSSYNAYAQSMTSLGYANAAGNEIQVPSNSNDFYSVTVPAPASTGFTVTATPVGNQAQDSCSTFTVNNFGVQNTSSNNVSSSGKACW